MALERIAESNSVSGYVYKVPYAYGATVPLKFSGISYSGYTPTDLGGITVQLLIKASVTDDDGDSLVDASNSDFNVTTNPLIIGYDTDTSAAGFSEGSIFYGELWFDDPTYGRQLIEEFQLHLNDPIKNTFS